MGEALTGYVIDVSAIMDLDGENRDAKFTDDPVIQGRVWEGCAGLIASGRLVTAAVARREMKKNCPIAYCALRPFGRKFFIPDSAQTLAAMTTALGVAAGRTRRRAALARMEPADPYLIALAMVRGLPLVTGERGRAERPPHLQRVEKIPDWCAKVGVKAIHLEDLVRAEGWC